MIFAFLFLGLLPLVFLTDAFTGTSDGGDDAADAHDETAQENDAGRNGDMLTPNNGDDDPGAGDPVDGPVLQPSNGDDEPVVSDPIDPATLLDPSNGGATDFPSTGDGSLLQQLLASETDFNIGSGYLDEYGSATSDTELTAGDDSFAATDDGIAGNGAGSLGDWDGTPVLTDDAPVAVISGGAGDDQISLGDGAAYAFGGDGADALHAGDGAAALFGGAGDDTLTGSDSASVWMDGGAGSDIILGGAADEVLRGGEHIVNDPSQPDDDVIDGGGGNDSISGGYGADTLSGGIGDDVIDHLGRVDQEISWERHEFGWHIDNEADTLSGGTGNDTLIMDRADSAEGGEGNDTFWVYFDTGSGSGAADISDFTSGEDFLRITLNPDIVKSDPVISVGPSEDGQDGLVTVNGETVAILRGAPGATEADIYVEVVDNVFGG